MTAPPLRKVLATWHATVEELATIAAAVGDGVEVVTPNGPAGLSRYECSLEAIAEHLEDAEAIVGWVLPRGALARARSLRLLCWLHAGIDEASRRIEPYEMNGAGMIERNADAGVRTPIFAPTL